MSSQGIQCPFKGCSHHWKIHKMWQVCLKYVLSSFHSKTFQWTRWSLSHFSHCLHIIPLSFLIYPLLWMLLDLPYFFQPSSVTWTETCFHAHMEKLSLLSRKITFICSNGNMSWNLLNLSAFLWLTNISTFQHTSVSDYFLKVNRLSYF